MHTLFFNPSLELFPSDFDACSTHKFSHMPDALTMSHEEVLPYDSVQDIPSGEQPDSFSSSLIHPLLIVLIVKEIPPGISVIIIDFSPCLNYMNL